MAAISKAQALALRVIADRLNQGLAMDTQVRQWRVSQ
jgi:hypothetical protein